MLWPLHVLYEPTIKLWILNKSLFIFDCTRHLSLQEKYGTKVEISLPSYIVKKWRTRNWEGSILKYIFNVGQVENMTLHILIGMFAKFRNNFGVGKHE